jgi:MFS family permease
MSLLPRRTGVLVFLAFAFAYFFSALIRAITATLSPVLTVEFSLSASDLGLLAGGFFLGFAVPQLALGTWLDRYGPKRVILSFLSVAVLGCIAFSAAGSFTGLLAARILCGMGVGACLMAPLTGYRRWFSPPIQIRTNSWMLMTGSLGMVASTLPVQWLMPLVGWRPLFTGLALLVLLAMALIAWQVPAWHTHSAQPGDWKKVEASYAKVMRHPYFLRLTPLGFFSYGGLVAIQTLWATPWMIRVGGYTPVQATTGLFWINVTMLCTFWTWGMIGPWLARRGLNADYLIQRGVPVSLVILALLIVAGDSLAPWSATLLALFCMTTSVISLAQPSVAMAFPSELAGRALSAFNLVIFAGVFVVQWSIGLLVDSFRSAGLSEVRSFQAAFGVFLCCSIASYVYFVMTKSHNASAFHHE